MDIKAQITMELRGNTLLSEEEAEESKSFDSYTTMFSVVLCGEYDNKYRFRSRYRGSLAPKR